MKTFILACLLGLTAGWGVVVTTQSASAGNGSISIPARGGR